MDIDEKKMFLRLIERIIATRLGPDGKVGLLGVNETRRLALNLIYKQSTAARDYIDLCMSLYARAAIEDKVDMLVDGMKKLYELIFDQDEKEVNPCTIKTERKS